VDGLFAINAANIHASHFHQRALNNGGRAGFVDFSGLSWN